MDNDALKVITERLDQLQSTVDQTSRDLTMDRKDLQEFAIRVGSLENKIQEVWDIVNNLPERTKDKMQEVVKPMVKETKELKEQIKIKKFVAFIEKAKPKRFLFWKKGG
jgi:septal ring factor EnvC (AmiA/AmiB activator)